MFPLAASIYVFSGAMTLWYSWRNLDAYRKTGNQYSLNVFRLGILITVYFFFLGILNPTLIYFKENKLAGAIWVLGVLPLFSSLFFANKIALNVWGFFKLEKFVSFILPVVIILYILSHLIFAPSFPYMDDLGLLHWDVRYPFDLIFFFSLSLLVVVPGIFFITTQAAGRKAFLKKMLFGITFIFGGLGGAATVIFDQTVYPLLWCFVALFFGFFALGCIALVDVFLKEDKLKLPN